MSYPKVLGQKEGDGEKEREREGQTKRKESGREKMIKTNKISEFRARAKNIGNALVPVRCKFCLLCSM